MVKSRPENKTNNFCIYLYQAIRVLDLNDNQPLFFKKIYEFTVSENQANVSLNQFNPIEVFDLDADDSNSKIYFSIMDNESLVNSSRVHKHIQINDTNQNYPILFLNGSFDYEKNGNRFEFSLLAHDIDSNHNDTAKIVIKIEDINDNMPIFLNNNATFTIRENMPVNSFIGQLIAIDKDSSITNSDVSFRIFHDHFASLFRVQKSGVLSNKIVFNREIQSYYTLKIEAYDNGEPCLKQVGTFYVKIEDENDNEPVFVQPKESAIHYMHFKPLEKEFNESDKRIKLFDVQATDIDMGDNGQVS
jgi:hypothetical protein